MLISNNEVFDFLVGHNRDGISQEKLWARTQDLKASSDWTWKEVGSGYRKISCHESTLAIKDADFATLQNSVKELEELREMKEVYLSIYFLLDVNISFV